MKGYILEPIKYEPTTEQALVGCQRCRNTWREEYTFMTSLRINGPMYCYEVCDKCKTEKDKTLTK